MTVNDEPGANVKSHRSIFQAIIPLLALKDKKNLRLTYHEYRRPYRESNLVAPDYKAAKP